MYIERNYCHNEYIWISSNPMYSVHVMYKTYLWKHKRQLINRYKNSTGNVSDEEAHWPLIYAVHTACPSDCLVKET